MLQRKHSSHAAEAAVPPPHIVVANTWAEIAAQFPTEKNFLLEGECTPTPASSFHFPSAAAIVDELRRHPDARISTGAPRQALDLGNDAETLRFAEAFRVAPLEQVLSRPFALAHFGLEAFDVPGGLLEGLRTQLVEPWAVALQRAGFAFHRCYPILFITNSGGKPAETSYHMDRSHVVACQIHGRKRWTWLRDPSRWADRETRLNHTAGQLKRPELLSAGDTVTFDMGPGSVLFNKLLTPHWVEAVDGEGVAVSLNISHGGLALNGELTRNEAELMQHVLQQHQRKDGRKVAVAPPVGNKPAWDGLPGQHRAKF